MVPTGCCRFSIRMGKRGRFLLAAACFLLLAAAVLRGQAPSGPRVDVDALKAALDAGAAMLLIDVREDWEVESGSMPGAVHVPMAELERRMADIPRDVRLVFF